MNRNNGNLDINTPRGQQSAKDELKAYRIIEACMPGIKIAITKKDSTCALDATMNDTKAPFMEVVGGIETKCRYDVTAERFFAPNGYQGEWLITARHVEEAAQITCALHVPLYGVLYIVQSNVVYMQMLADENGAIMNLLGQEMMETKATTNGGIALRLNSFFDMHDAVKMVPPAGLKPATTR